jgi:hypothetical protein
LTSIPKDNNNNKELLDKCAFSEEELNTVTVAPEDSPFNISFIHPLFKADEELVRGVIYECKYFQNYLLTLAQGKNNKNAALEMVSFLFPHIFSLLLVDFPAI